MDTKGLQHCKHPKKMKSSNDNGNHEVFVLPPDLLKKLGISIGNINSTQVIPTSTNVAPSPEIINNEQITNIPTADYNKNSSDSSILETASLMKKSVFLSPTFISTTTNVIPGEVEISSKTNSVAVTDLGAQSSIYIPVNGFENTNLVPGTYETEKVCNKVEEVKLSCDFTVNGVFKPVSNINQDYSHMSIDGNEVQLADVITITHKNVNSEESGQSDILYDAHSSKSTRNLENTKKSKVASCVSNEIVDKNVKHEQKSSSKINIISEETIPMSKLKKIRSLQASNINTLTPVTVKTIINNKSKKENNSSKATGTSKLISTVTVNKADLNVNSEVNTDDIKLKPKDNAQNNAAPTVIPSQRVEDTCGQNSDIASNIIKNTKVLENEKGSKHNDQLSLPDHAITASEGTPGQSVPSDKEAILIGQFNNHYQSLDDTISENIVTVNGFNSHGLDIENVDAHKFLKKTEDGQMDMSTEPQVGHTHNHHSTENEHEPKDANAGKPRAIEKVKSIGNDDITENSSNIDIKFESDGKQVPDSKTIDDNDCSMRIIDGKQTSNNITTLNKIKDDTLCNDELANILNATKELSSSNSNIKADKVKEIAAYLKKFSHIYTDKKKIKKDLRNDKKQKINSNTSTIKSKLSIQGVEKPGGIEVDNEHTVKCKVLKTYIRCNHVKKSNPSTNILLGSATSNTVDASTNLQIDTVNISKCDKMQEFCLCYDFGRLAYYDYDNVNSVYEHIHFWQHNPADCDLNVILAIYSDEAIVNNNESGLDPEEKTEENIETYNVCWNVLQNEFSENVDISDPEPIDEMNVRMSKIITEPILNNVVCPQDENITVKEISIDSEILDYGHMMTNNQDSDNISQTVNHEMVGSPELNNCDSIQNDQNRDASLNTEHTDNADPTVVPTVDTADGENKDKDFNNIESNLISSSSPTISMSSQSDIADKMSQDASSAAEESAFDTKEKSNTNDQHTDSESNTIKSSEEQLDSPKPSENIALKRRLSLSATASESSQNSNDEPSLKKNIKCGLCNNLFSESDWDDHVANRHYLIAWKDGHSINLDSPVLLNNLKERLEAMGVLKCSICKTKWKKLKKFINHVKDCIKEKDSDSNKTDEKPSRKSRAPVDEIVTCGVCQQSVQSIKWLEHIGRNHDYLAWIQGQKSLNLEDEAMVWEHLQNIIRLDGSLTCYKCGLNRRRVKLYLAHIKTCDGSGISLDDSSMSVDLTSTSNLEPKMVKCGVCSQEVTDSKWIEHIAKEHNYLAWQDGKPPLNLDEEEVVWNHLQQFIRQKGGLTCYKCGLNRRRVKLYLSHVETCDGTGVSMDDSSMSFDLNSSSNYERVQRSVSSAFDEKIVECGVCKEKVTNSNWIMHIGKEHNYLAWQDGTTPLDLDNEDAVWQHLQQIIKSNDGLICHKCGLQRKRVKLYLAHVETCDGSESRDNSAINNMSLDSTLNTDQWYEVPIISEEKKIVKCGVCSVEVPIVEWMQHMGKEHNYLAWQDGSTPLNLEDELAVRAHLLNISRQNGGLTCSMCNKNIKYPKTYIQHIKECTGVTVSLDDSKLNDSDSQIIMLSKKIKSESVTCGVCGAKVAGSEWFEHIQQAHQYLAWMEGQPPVDLEDAATVHRHLTDISKMAGGLVCLKCGVRRKYVKSYQQHIETCEGNMFGGELSLEMMSKDFLECGICAEKVPPKEWRDHAMKAHYNIAWVAGETPIDLNSPYTVESFLKEYLHRNNKLVCKVCGITRASCVGFYAHIITCGKTEEETEMYKNVCDICHHKYLIIYKSQHMTMHREQEYALERKALAAKEKELKREEPEDVIQGGRRKAAEKAKTVIEKYKDTIQEGAHRCSKCGFGTDIENELSDHVCVDSKWGDASDSDESVKLDCSDDESDESDIDSNISDEEQEAREHDSHKKKRYSDNTSSTIPASKIVRLPYQIKSINTYMKRSTDEFVEAYLTDEDIFPQWHNCEFEAVPDNELVNYMPPLEESCKVRLDENLDWASYNRFESRREKDTIIMFVGASVQCMSWAPAHAGAAQAQYVAVLGHAQRDVPRLPWDATPAGSGLIQIWDCGNLISSTPQFALGIAHDYGTIWAIDWCPSGARDVADYLPEPDKIHRLGLLAAACSNGSAYIFLVPYPSAITEKDKLFYKIKPIVELRLAMNTDRKCHDNRKSYQATAIKWSVQKGHSNVVVGYADGTTAFYDLNGESPLLRTTENDVTVFYPYHDERVQNSCIEDVDMFPSGAARGGVVAVGSAGGAGAGALQSHVAAARVLFPPHWPAALLAGDDCLVNLSINELEWWGGGRRLGGMRVAAGCAWCGRVAAAALPVLRLLRLHPCFPEVHKQVIGTIQMAPLGSKRKRQTDELAMIVEPITYDDAVKKYGIEFKQITARDRATQQKLSSMPREAFPERFPLSDVTAMQFCPSFRHHHKLALAMHAGLIFIVNV